MKPHILSIIFLGMTCHIVTIFCAVNPQPGENMWHILAAVGTDLDELAQNKAECCVGTFTALQSVQDTICSKIDVLDDVLNNCCFTTVSKIDDLTCCYTIASKLDTLSLCQPIALTIDQNGTTIATSGSYALINEVSLNIGSNITINANDVFFDLNNHRITGGQGIIISPNNNRVTVQNGYIISSATSGILLAGLNEDVLLDTININATSVGITCTNQTNIVMSNLNISSVDFGILATSCNNSTIQNCSIVGKSDGSSTNGIAFNPGSEIVLNNCWTVKQTTVDSFASGFNILNVSSLLMEGCVACNNLGAAATSAGFIIQDTLSSFVQKHILKRCTSQVNSSHGFLITNGGATTSFYTLENCTALGKNITNVGTGSGFEISRPNGVFISCKANLLSLGFDILEAATDCLFEKCQSVDNGVLTTSHGFLITGARAVLTSCLALNNFGRGFQLNNPNNLAYACDIENCIAAQNGLSGFLISQNANNASIRNCSSYNNQGNGFVFGISPTLNQTISKLLFSQCVACGNLNNGFDLQLMTTATTSTATVEKCTAVGNGITVANNFGFNRHLSLSNTTNAAFYLNSAHSNGTTGTNNYNNLGLASPAPVSITGTPLYGDNLTN